MSNTATLISARTSYRGAPQRLYKLDPPAEDTHEYVVVSAVLAPYSGPETCIFPADQTGEITDFGELEGSYRGGLDHAQALAGLGDGYAIKES